MKAYFTVGEFAKICNLSKQTLIFYDKKDLLKPNYRSKSNGYRYYSADQLEQVDSIMMMREMGLSLEEIKRHMENRSPENSLKMLVRQQQAVHQKIKKLQEIENRIKMKKQSIQNFYQQDPVFHICEMPKQILAIEPVQSPHGLLQVDIALKKLLKKVGQSSEHFFQMGDSVAKEHLLAHQFLKFKYAFLPMEKEAPGVNTKVKEKGLYAIQYHFGPYETMGETYQKMLASIKNANAQVIGDTYEFCILDSFTSSAPDQYCTQIQIPIKF